MPRDSDPQMLAARGEGRDSGSPEILKVNPDNRPYHDEYTGHSCQGKRRKEEKETGAENTGRAGGRRTGGHLGLLQCSRHKDSQPEGL